MMLKPLQVQLTASSAVEWCRDRGGHVEKNDMVSRISQLGAGGKHKANIERDFHSLLKCFNKRLGAQISTVQARTLAHKNIFSLGFGAIRPCVCACVRVCCVVLCFIVVCCVVLCSVLLCSVLFCSVLFFSVFCSVFCFVF